MAWWTADRVVYEACAQAPPLSADDCMWRSMAFDSRYLVVNLSDLARVLGEWREGELPRLHYRAELFDCDDFAEYFAVWAKLRLGTNAVGVAIGSLCYVDENGVFVCGGHAWNIAVTNYGVKCIEPQLGEVVPCTGRSRDGFVYILSFVVI